MLARRNGSAMCSSTRCSSRSSRATFCLTCVRPRRVADEVRIWRRHVKQAHLGAGCPGDCERVLHYGVGHFGEVEANEEAMQTVHAG